MEHVTNALYVVSDQDIHHIYQKLFGEDQTANEAGLATIEPTLVCPYPDEFQVSQDMLEGIKDTGRQTRFAELAQQFAFLGWANDLVGTNPTLGLVIEPSEFDLILQEHNGRTIRTQDLVKEVAYKLGGYPDFEQFSWQINEELSERFPEFDPIDAYQIGRMTQAVLETGTLNQSLLDSHLFGTHKFVDEAELRRCGEYELLIVFNTADNEPKYWFEDLVSQHPEVSFYLRSIDEQIWWGSFFVGEAGKTQCEVTNIFDEDGYYYQPLDLYRFTSVENEDAAFFALTYLDDTLPKKIKYSYGNI